MNAQSRARFHFSDPVDREISSNTTTTAWITIPKKQDRAEQHFASLEKYEFGPSRAKQR
jgi:hypothetical protein